MKPRIVCYCGSIRVALDAFKKAEYDSLMRGEIALLPCCMFVDIEREYGKASDYKVKADDLHKRKIDICDEVFILNVGGYIGESTRSEIEYALSIMKPVRFLERYDMCQHARCQYPATRKYNETPVCVICEGRLERAFEEEFR